MKSGALWNCLFALALAGCSRTHPGRCCEAAAPGPAPVEVDEIFHSGDCDDGPDKISIGIDHYQVRQVMVAIASWSSSIGLTVVPPKGNPHESQATFCRGAPKN